MMKRPTKYKPLLTVSEYKYLSHNYFETSNFYCRPKIQKSEILHKAIKEQNKELITILELNMSKATSNII